MTLPKLFSVVSIAAHQDDIELSCLGTLIKFQQRGNCRITNITLTNGDKGSQHDPRVPYEEVSKIRIAEADAVAAALGGRHICLGYPDEYLMVGDEVINKVVDLLREAQADLVFAPPLVDYQIDHTAASSIAYQAVMLAGVKTIFTDHDPLEKYPTLYYMDSITGMEFQPTVYVDITPVFERKIEVLQLHKSQMKNMEQSGWDLVKYARIVNAFRGIQCGVEYAEGFRPCLGWPRVQPGCPLP